MDAKNYTRFAQVTFGGRKVITLSKFVCEDGTILIGTDRIGTVTKRVALTELN